MSAFGAVPSILQPPNAAFPRHKHSRADLSSPAPKRSQVVFTALGPTVLRPPRKPTVYYADRWDAYPTCVDINNNDDSIGNEGEVLSEADFDRGHEVTFESIAAATATGGEGDACDEVIGGAATSRSVDQEHLLAMLRSTVERAAERDTSLVDLDGKNTDSVENIRDGEQDKAVDGPTALMEACWHGRVNVVRKLLRDHHAKSCVYAKLNPTYRNRQQQYKLQRYTKRSHLMRISGDSHNPVEALLESDWFGSPLHYACIAGRTTCARLLLFGEIDECLESDGKMKKEVRWEVPEVTSDVSQPSTNVLECSACMGSRHFLRVVDPWARNSYGSTPLHKAAASGSLPTIQLFLSLLAHPQHSSASVCMSKLKGNGIGKCNCSHTSYCGCSDFRGNPLEATNWRGDRPLHAAARSGSLACCAVLLAAGCNGSARNSAGQTALDVAEAKNHVEAAAVLRTAALQRVSCDDEETNDANGVNDSLNKETSWNECVRDGGVGNGNGHAAVEMVKRRHAYGVDAALSAAARAPVSLAESSVPSVGAHLVPLDASLASQRQFFPVRIIDIPKPQWYSDEPPQSPQPPFELYAAPSAARADQPALQAASDRQKSEQEEKSTSRAAYKAPTEGYDFLLSPAQQWGSPIS